MRFRVCVWQSGLFELGFALHLRLMIRTPRHGMISIMMGLPMTGRLPGEVDEVQGVCVCVAVRFV